MVAVEPPFCPFKGLAPFEEQDYAYFFGRERETRLIVANLFASPLTLLYGASGVGKSSVLRAGAMHALRSNEDALSIPPFARWHHSPLKELKHSIVTAAGVEWNERQASTPLKEIVGGLCGQLGRRVMIVLDQFEEFFLYNQPDDRFARELADAVLAPGIDVGFVISLRDDALARLDAFEGLIPNLFENYLRIEHLDRAAARAAIENPLERYNDEFPADATRSIEPALVDAVLNELGSVHLSESARAAEKAAHTRDTADRIETPYLQLVITTLWDEEARRHSQRLRFETYTRLGGAEQIVRTHVEEVLNTRLTADERQMASQIFHYLVTPSRAKIAHSAADLAVYAGVPPDQMKTMLTKLVGGRDRILRTVANPNDAKEERFEIFHDRLATAILEWRGRYLRESVAASPDAAMPQAPHAPTEERIARPEQGTAICLSGGGYRAVLFHTGVLWRLNEAGMLPSLDAVATVSAGAIVGCLLGVRWERLAFDTQGVAQNFVEEIVAPIRRMTTKTIDVSGVVQGLLGVGQGRWTRAFRTVVGDTSLDRLPARPHVIVSLVNLATGTRLRSEGGALVEAVRGERYAGITLAELMVASAVPSSFTDIRLPSHRDIALTDGSTLDRLGTESVWRRYDTLLVSDGASGTWSPRDVPTDILRRTLTVFDLLDFGSRSIAKRQVLDAFRNRDRKGAYWSLGSVLENYAGRAFDVPPSLRDDVAAIPARLAALDDSVQESLINWGYVVADAGLRTHCRPELPLPTAPPFPGSGAAYTPRAS